MDRLKKEDFFRGIRLGLPIGMGYFSVSFAFGMMAVSNGLSPLLALIISMTNLTSAGQVAGVQLIAAGGTYLEMALTMLMINARYFLMSLSLSQKMSRHLSGIKRLAMAFSVTDEIFAVASMEVRPLSGWYWFGLSSMPYIGWTTGTLTGALLSGILPYALKDALGIAIYGMFIAIIIPAAKHSRAITATLILAILVRCILYYIPIFKEISVGFAVILVTIVASSIMALIKPIEIEEEEEE